MPVTTNPLQVQTVSDAKPRAPTLQECAIIIKHLKEKDERQSHEVMILYTVFIKLTTCKKMFSLSVDKWFFPLWAYILFEVNQHYRKRNDQFPNLHLNNAKVPHAYH